MGDSQEKKHRILLVDDDPDVLRVLTRGLEAGGFEVMPASGGDEALELFTEHGADAVVSDMVMAEKAGLSLLRDIRKASPETRTVAISGGGAIDASFYLQAADATGVDGVLQKPFDPSQLVEVLEKLLAERAGKGEDEG